MKILLYIFGAFLTAIGGIGIIFELLSISIFADRELSSLYYLFPNLTEWITVPITLVTGTIAIVNGNAMMNKAWGDDSNNE